ncbi:TetR/AcrR family transcriptional regulator [Corallococcus sp. CA053C]|uniref:TetR/AcrR family transcriptional regulator n=1 Tax=Corallococcus sp. CA053C TaxID=2316732 RepID=UPI000EA35EA8|nr:TetR/AcrR family transcriptional regulator [Corallococcus sp. CA053C]RKH13599.1 TetR/AcrR family transcriptional regulator [Corallococcus sp. CA053C]
MTVRRTRRTQEERRDEAARRMLAAGARLVAERGPQALTLAQVGQAAGYSRGLPAHHFGSKAEFLHELMRYVASEFRAAMDAFETEEGLPALLKMLGSFFARPTSDPSRLCALRIVLSEPGTRPGRGHDLATLRQQTIRALEKWIRQGMELGQIRAGVDARMTSLLLATALCGAMGLWLEDHQFDLEAAGSQLAELVHRGLAVSITSRSGPR